jgi:SAM-dependent methyltransferase
MTVGAIPSGWRFAGTALAEPPPPSDLLACSNCSLYFRWPSPSVDELAVRYQQGRNEKWDYDRSARVDWALAAARLNAIDAPARVLDIGCWDGAFLSLLRSNWEAHGVEIHPDAARTAENRGVRMIGTTLERIEGYADSFDAVTAFDVIEHVHNPAKLADDMVKLAKPGGLIIIGTGNTQALTWRLMGSRYWYCTNVEHISFIGERWCQWYAANRSLRLDRIIAYSHAVARSPLRSAKQAALNLTYRFVPGLMRRLRKSGFGGINASEHAAWSDAPPNWATARDHILAIFRKP